MPKLIEKNGYKIYKHYKYDKSIKDLSWNEKSKDYKWYLLVDEYVFDRPNVISHVHGRAHERKGVQPTIPLNKDFPIDVKLEEVKKESSLTCSKENKIKDENLLNECYKKFRRVDFFLWKPLKLLKMPNCYCSRTCKKPCPNLLKIYEMLDKFFSCM